MAVPIVMPRLGDFMMEGTVTTLTKSAGDPVSQGEVIAEIETEKVNYDLEATESGVFHPVVEEGATVAVDGLIGYVLAEGEAPPEAPSPQPAPVAPRVDRPASTSRPAAPVRGDVVPSTPGARRLAAKLDVDISEVTPSGPRGRVVEADVRAHAEDQQAARIPAGLPEPSKSVPMEGIRKTIAEHMQSSISGTAQLSYVLELDVTEAQQRRRQFSKETDSTVTLGHVLMKAVAEALKRVPALNTVLSGGNILYFDEANIGFAVALDEGLIVPVVRDVGGKDIRAVSAEAGELAGKAREGRLLPDDVLGGTFTISVLGVVDAFTPILNRGQSAILGVGRSVEKPVVKDGEIVVREMITVSLTADHQVVDGAVATGFLRRFQQMVERPAQLFR
ncbi:MAG: 2-oxo acid dehydrogenase subunit E2 [Chloroflexi bacterium]|nr:2-oxo acid dehydrogenase subunit E2 [Chloroflexota bacterium]